MSDHIVYEFTCSGLEPDQSLSVIDFKGFEAISRPYEFTINLKSESPDIDMEAMLSAPCTFRMKIGPYERPVHGILSDFEQLHQVDRFTFYRAVLVPKLWQLSLYQTNEIYLNDQADRPGTDVPEILDFILKECGLNKEIDYRTAIYGTYPQFPYRCQWNETHLNYISRLMEHEGIYYYFEQGEERERIVFCDLLQGHTPVEAPGVNYSPAGGLDIETAVNNIHALVCRQKRMPHKVILKDYNYEKPNLDVTGNAIVDPKGVGDVFRYGDNFETPEEGNRLAGIRAQEIFAGKERYFGESMVSRLVPGYLFHLLGHYREAFNRKYLVTEIRHEGAAPSFLSDRGDAEPMSAYHNSFTAIPSIVQFRPERVTEKPRFHGQINAVVDGEASGTYAELDDQGRYKIRLPFDREDSHGQGKASWWFRKAEPHAGANEGMHFPLRKNTEVLLSFIDGDPDRPVISSAIANPASPNVVTGKNQTSNVIRTHSGNLMELEDADGRNRIKFSTPQKGTYFHLGAPNAAGDGIVGVTKGIYRLEIGGGKQHTFAVNVDYDVTSPYVKGDIVRFGDQYYTCKKDLSAAPAYDSNTTYKKDDHVSDSDKRYSSMQDSNKGKALDNDSWWEEVKAKPGSDSSNYWTVVSDSSYGSTASIVSTDDTTTNLFEEQNIFKFKVMNSNGEFSDTDMDDENEVSGKYLIDRHIGPQYKWSRGNEYIFNYGGTKVADDLPTTNKTFEYGNTFLVAVSHSGSGGTTEELIDDLKKKVKYCDDNKIVYTESITNKDILVNLFEEKHYWINREDDNFFYCEPCDFYGSTTSKEPVQFPKNTANYEPKNIIDYYGSPRTWGETIGRARVSLAEHDTITGQKGNIYDFGGYWNYNLGNSYVENHLDQNAELNAVHNLDILADGGPNWVKKSDIDERVISPINSWKTDLYLMKTEAFPDGIDGGLKEACKPYPLKNELFNSNFVGLYEDQADWNDKWTNIWVEKKFGNSYEYTEGSSISITDGDSQDVTFKGTHLDMTIGGTHIERKFAGDTGHMTYESTSDAGVTKEYKYNRDRGNLVYASYSGSTEGGASNFSAILQSSIKMEAHLLGFSCSISAHLGGSLSLSFKTAANFDFNFHLGTFDFKLTLGHAFVAEMEANNSGKFEYDFVANKGKFKGVDLEINTEKNRVGEMMVNLKKSLLKSQLTKASFTKGNLRTSTGISVETG